jgi:hypothetical protein
MTGPKGSFFVMNMNSNDITICRLPMNETGHPARANYGWRDTPIHVSPDTWRIFTGLAAPKRSEGCVRYVATLTPKLEKSTAKRRRKS